MARISLKEKPIMRIHVALCVILIAVLASTTLTAPTPPPSRVTILYDAFGGRSDLERDWGFAALVEHGGKRILFDTGNNADLFARNVKKLGINLRRIDFVVISHRHGDHTAGLSYLLKMNPRVKVYAPKDGLGGVFGTALPATFYRRESSLPEDSRYFNGEPPDPIKLGSHWPKANFVLLDSILEVAPGVSIIATVSEKPGTVEMRELSLALQTPAGLILIVGCSHPGIETILAASTPLADHVHLVLGGLHLVTTPDAEVERVVMELHDRWRVDRIAPGHCTGEPAFLALQRAFGKEYLHAGLGRVIDLP
jgi:7,8-dihydropterin-6-yl-methyl-4-(beta-D-ribofuranosyl)aminobenzene 5'-phosphate synthase